MTASLGEGAASAEQETIDAGEVVFGSEGDDTLSSNSAANLLAGVRGDPRDRGRRWRHTTSSQAPPR